VLERNGVEGAGDTPGLASQHRDPRAATLHRIGPPWHASHPRSHAQPRRQVLTYPGTPRALHSHHHPRQPHPNQG
jgi:hypothetical protein